MGKCQFSLRIAFSKNFGTFATKNTYIQNWEFYRLTKTKLIPTLQLYTHICLSVKNMCNAMQHCSSRTRTQLHLPFCWYFFCPCTLHYFHRGVLWAEEKYYGIEGKKWKPIMDISLCHESLMWDFLSFHSVCMCNRKICALFS